MAKPKNQAQRIGAVRCAVYTRKSTEEGLDQNFNSLDAQREACEAYILSQRHEGWMLVRESYDDGGFSGGNMERPGIKRLLADVEAGRVDVIVVYKVDRLTRSLADFAKIVDILDARSASFVSVTQSFNTTTSMGRLTLNVLLSFAQFEREVTGERIRDKIAASKAKGMWMGGTPSLGYEVEDRKLIVNEAEAEQVRHIMERYVALGCGRALIDELKATGYRTKKFLTRGGIPFSRGGLFHLLNNRIYLGEVVHKGVSHEGQHQAIVERHLWDAVQATMASQRVQRSRGDNFKSSSLLAGRLIDGEGRRMSPSHATKSGRRYRYYVTPADSVTELQPAWRVPAHDLETAVIRLVKQMLDDRRQIVQITGAAQADALKVAIILARKLNERLDNAAERRLVIADLGIAVRLAEDGITVEIASDAIARALGQERESGPEELAPIILMARAAKVRRGKDVKLVIADNDGTAIGVRDETLVSLIVESREAYDLVRKHPELSIKELAKQTGRCRNRFHRLVGIAMLAPDIVIACLDGTQPVRLTAHSLFNTELSVGWDDQRRLLGFA